MPVITIRLDEDTREAMRRVQGVNWSEIIRQKIREVTDQHMKENRVKALLTMQELYRKAPPGFDSTKVIRYWRERRYGPRRGRR